MGPLINIMSKKSDYRQMTSLLQSCHLTEWMLITKWKTKKGLMSAACNSFHTIKKDNPLACDAPVCRLASAGAEEFTYD